MVMLLWAPGVFAQVRGSERGTMTQVVNGTTITVDFGRPVASGRDNLFGGVVHWGETWTPGANWATTLEVDRPVLLDGNRVEPGKYSVWLQPQDGDSWVFLLNREWRLYHDSPFPAERVMLSVPVSPGQGGHMKALNWYVHSLDFGTATLRMHWGPTFIELDVETEPYTWDPLPRGERATWARTPSIPMTPRQPGRCARGERPARGPMGERADRFGSSGARRVHDRLPAGRKLFDVADELTLRILVEDGVSTGAEFLWEGEVFGRGVKTR